MIKRASTLLLRFYKLSRGFDATEIVTFGLIFYGLSVFFNRPNLSTGIFISMEKVTGINQEVWAIAIVICVVIIRLPINHTLQFIAALVLFAIIGFMWRSIWFTGLAWQGVITSTVCAIACVKASFDDMLANILVKQGRL